MRKVPLLCFLLLVSGCATHDFLVESVESPKKGGAVEYFYLVDSAKERLYSKAMERAELHCGGEVEVLKTVRRSEGFNNYETVHFSCK